MSNDLNRQDEDGIGSSSNDLFYTREMSDILYFIEENEENENYYTQDLLNNSLNNSLSNNSLNNSLSNNSLNNSLSGEIWNYFKKGADLGRGNYEAECNWCNKKWSRGHPKDMKIHLVRNCEKVCCGFLFQTIENLFIIDLFRITISGYILPSRTILSEKLLDQETIRIEKKIENDLKYSNYLTISLDGWISSRHDSIYNYLVTTSTRKEYLIKLKNYNIKKQTAVVTDHGANLRVA
ncbi:8367_t:CDS:2 [Diversispora eburnea]|uniref:8367_t:CDS:1 n=1 Tax=Diversispora eburnea TaxID=1213867 RepID=A0A9N9C6A1_9GLOM|nr:8367_t:CDS:2 [Diversispora eburnea]